MSLNYIFYDDFSSDLSQWNNTTNASVSGGILTVTNNDSAILMSKNKISASFFVLETNVLFTTTAKVIGLAFRIQDNNNFYMWQLTSNASSFGGQLRIHKKVNGTFTLFKTVSYSFDTTTYNIRLVIQNNIIQTYVNNGLIDTTIDNTFLNPGYIGFRESTTSEVACIDDIKVYKVINYYNNEIISYSDSVSKINFKRNNVILGTINNPIVNQEYNILDYVSGLNYKDILVVEGYDSNNNLQDSLILNVKEDFTGKQGILVTTNSIDTKDWDSINSIQTVGEGGNLFIDFENNDYLSYFVGDWVRVSTSPYRGQYCYRNKDIGDYQTSQTQITIYIPSSSLLSFWYRVSSEANFDKLWFYIDGVEKLGGKSGNIGWTQVAYVLTAGTHTLIWKYTKDSGLSTGEDSAYIDNLSISNTKPLFPFILSNDNKQTWYTYQNNQFIPVTNPTTDIFTQGITDLSNLPPLTKQNFLKDKLDIMVGMESSSTNENPIFKGININYKINDYIITTYSRIDTINVNNSEYIYQSSITDSVYKFNFTVNGDGYKVFFSKDGGNTWLTYNGIDFIEGGNGNYIWEINNLSQELLMQFLPINNFRIKFVPLNNRAVLNSITINYSVKTNSIFSLDAKEALLPVPPEYFRNVLQEDNTYTLKLEEGLSFDDVNKDYDFYTTPTKVKLRPLDMGTVIGNKWSVVQAFEVINSHENQDYDIELKVAYNNEEAIIKDNTALLNDTDLDSEKTIVEFSLTQDPFELIYPVKFRLDRNSKQVVYFKIKPTIVTEGTKTFQIRLTATPL